MFVLCCGALGLLTGAVAPRLAAWAVRAPARGTAGAEPATGPVRAVGPAVGSAAAAGVVGWAVGPQPATVAFLAMAVLGVPLAIADRRHLRLPDRLLIAAALPATAALAGAAACGGEGTRLARAALAACAVAGGYLALSLAPGAALGLGDVKLAGLLGFPLGWLGWQAALAGAVLPHLLAGPVAAAMLATGRAGRHTRIPFGPALLCGALLALVLWRLRQA